MVAPRVGSSQKSACSLLCCQPGMLRQLGSDACTPSEARAGYTEVSRWLIKTGDSQPSLLLSSTFFFPLSLPLPDFLFRFGAVFAARLSGAAAEPCGSAAPCRPQEVFQLPSTRCARCCLPSASPTSHRRENNINSMLMFLC